MIKYREIFRVLFWIWGITILLLSVWPYTPRQQIRLFGSPFRVDYFEHFFVYVFLGILFILQRGRNVRPGVFIVMLLFVFAGFTESVQLFIPGRAFNPYDLTYNILGLAAGGYLMHLLILKKFKSIVN